MTTLSRYLADTKPPLTLLKAKVHFDALSLKEKLYSHHIAKASWFGVPILARTMSLESLTLVKVLLHVFKSNPSLDALKAKVSPSLVSETAFQHFVDYSIQVLNNLGNYKSFGDVKFLPRLNKEELLCIMQAASQEEEFKAFETIKDVVFSVDPEEQMLFGYPADGHVSGYYSPNVSKSDIDLVGQFLVEKNISPLNTRLLKKGDSSFTVLIASAIETPVATHSFKGKEITVQYGDFQASMVEIAKHMQAAIPYAANENQKKMLESYAESFTTGSIEAHKESQKWWIKDVGPVVETNIGFIETYRDPSGTRAEWEGFVAVVNKERTARFEELVANAELFISMLPWGKEFEKDVFNKPDFTSLEVVSFATSGSPPAGINIPNYDDIRQNFGFKNVSLGNIVGAKVSDEKVTFIEEKDVALYNKYQSEAFEVQVGLHELLGHGCGKLLSEESAGKFNFDQSHPPVSPLTGKPVTSWYKPGETWGSVFKSASNSFEECRAECVAMFLCVNKKVLEIFGFHHPQEQKDITYICFLNMARAGLTSLEFYDPKSCKWGQAHMQARFAILQVFLQCGLVEIKHSPSSGLEAGNLEIHLDAEKIVSHAVPAVGEFLKALHVYKATANAVQGLEFYTKATTVSPEWGSAYRDIVLARKLPRKVFVQGNTFLQKDGSVVFKEYPATQQGFIDSFIEREFVF